MRNSGNKTFANLQTVCWIGEGFMSGYFAFWIKVCQEVTEFW